MRPHTIMTALLSLLVAAPCALAEDEWVFANRNRNDMQGFGMSTPEPPITAVELERYAETLELDETQRDVAKDLHTSFMETYLQKWLAHAEASADQRAKNRYNNDWSTLQERMRERMTEHRETVETLTDRFLDDLRLLLDAEQETLWKELERDRRRQKYIPEMSANDRDLADLVAVVGVMDIDDSVRAEIDPILDEYAVEIDAALESYIKKAERLDKKIDEHEETQTELMQAWQEDDTDQAALAEKQRKQEQRKYDLGEKAHALYKDTQRIADITKRYRRRVRAELPPSVYEAFDKATTKPADDDGNPLAGMSFSRYKQAVNTLENLNQMRTMFQSQLETMDEDSPFTSMMDLLRNAEPLSAKQQKQVERITADYEEAIEELEAEARRKTETSPTSDGDRTRFTVPTLRGSVTVQRQNEDGTWPGNMTGGGDNDDDAELQQKRAEIEQNAIDRLRDALDFYQRAAISQF